MGEEGQCSAHRSFQAHTSKGSFLKWHVHQMARMWAMVTRNTVDGAIVESFKDALDIKLRSKRRKRLEVGIKLAYSIFGERKVKR